MISFQIILESDDFEIVVGVTTVTSTSGVNVSFITSTPFPSVAAVILELNRDEK